MPRPPTRKKGPYTRAEIQHRYRQRQKRARPDPKVLAKQQRRAERELQLAEATIAASRVLGVKLYGVLYADCPWRFEPYSRKTGMDRAADNHYPTMSLDEIKALPVADWAAPNCVLFMWATVPMLPQPLEVVAAWGFEYRSAMFWDKGREGTGYWTRDRVEVLLIATRGKVPAPAPGEQPDQLIAELRGAHSVKPESFMREIERLYPNVPKLELFARGGPVPGWDRWGNEADSVAGQGPQEAGLWASSGKAAPPRFSRVLARPGGATGA